MSAVLWQRVEGGLVFLVALFGVFTLNADAANLPWWQLLILFFAPDLGFLGYLGGPRIGAQVYNVMHLYGAGLALAVVGAGLFGNGNSVVVGCVWMAHVGFDRMLGYGLKQPTGFGDTHLGRIGRQ